MCNPIPTSFGKHQAIKRKVEQYWVKAIHHVCRFFHASIVAASVSYSLRIGFLGGINHKLFVFPSKQVFQLPMPSWFHAVFLHQQQGPVPLESIFFPSTLSVSSTLCFGEIKSMSLLSPKKSRKTQIFLMIFHYLYSKKWS